MNRDEVLEALESGQDLSDLFAEGEHDYWAGVIPDGWNKMNANDNPYLAGWNMAAAQDNGIGFFERD